MKLYINHLNKICLSKILIKDLNIEYNLNLIKNIN